MGRAVFEGSSIKNEVDLKKCMTQIDFGYVDKNNDIHYDIDSRFRDNYVLQEPRNIMKSFVGTCFDEVELVREFFNENDIYSETYYMIAKGAGTVQNHAFIIFQSENMWGWFENYWKEEEGIHYYISKERLLDDVYKKFVGKCGRISASEVYQYTIPLYGITYDEFIAHCMAGNLVYSSNKPKIEEVTKVPNIFMAKTVKKFDINADDKE